MKHGEEIEELKRLHFDGFLLDSSLDRMVVLSGLPITPNREKLCLFVAEKLLSKYETRTVDIFADSETGHTTGCALIETVHRSDSESLQKALDGMRMDKKHRLSAVLALELGNVFGDGRMEISKQETAQKEKRPDPAIERRGESSSEYPSDEFFVHRRDRLEFYFVSTTSENEFFHSGEIVFPDKKTRRAEWSAKGRFVLCVDPRGAIVCELEKQQVYSVLDMEDIADVFFSPDEKHVVTLSRKMQTSSRGRVLSEDGVQAPAPESMWRSESRMGSTGGVARAEPVEFFEYCAKQTLCVWRLYPGEARCVKRVEAAGDTKVSVGWTGGEEAVVLKDSTISVLSPGGTRHVQGVSFLCFAGAADRLVYCVKESGSTPFRVIIADSAGTALKTRGLFGVERSVLSQVDTRVLCVMQRHEKGSEKTRIEIYSVAVRGIPVETVECDWRADVVSLQPHGNVLFVSGKNSADTPSPRLLRRGSVYCNTAAEKHRQEQEMLAHAAIIDEECLKTTRDARKKRTSSVCVCVECREEKVREKRKRDSETLCVYSVVSGCLRKTREYTQRGVQTMEWTFDGAFLLLFFRDAEEEGAEIFDRHGSRVGGFATRMSSGVFWDACGRSILCYSTVERNSERQTDCVLYDVCGRRVGRKVLSGIVDVQWRPSPQAEFCEATAAGLCASIEEHRQQLRSASRKKTGGDPAQSEATPDASFEAWRAGRAGLPLGDVLLTVYTENATVGEICGTELAEFLG
ncbi:MAG: translation initiation factor eIF3B [Amphiamblys sp. WSBS2006]|nr:MAG: translation initiation factor eIF3B [Amphiamblys sp. WSBS2006]